MGPRSGSTPLSPDDPESFAARLRARHGADVDPEISLDPAAADARDSAASGASSELLQRLADHSLKVSRYKLQGEIARGGMGAILKVWDDDLRRTLAMKVILGKADSPAASPPNSSPDVSMGGGTPPVDARTLGRFVEEAQVTGQLDHPGIAPVHELGLDSDGRVYFTMKLVKGRDLKRILDLVFDEQEGWHETRALSVMLKVCEAMAYAHTKGVIHRDLKPANVMVGSFGEVYVMDWGLARVLGRKDSHDIRLRPEFASSLTSVKTERREEREEAADAPLVTMDGDVMGTPAYMPPEQARGEIEKLSARSDVYALGAMIYHLLARRMPYVPPGARVSNRTVLAMVLQGPPLALTSLRKDVPAELAAICEKAMSRDAAGRYADTLALAEDLRAYLEHRVVGAYETGTWAETKKWVQRNKPLAASLAAGVLALALGLIVSASLKQRADANAELAETRRVESEGNEREAKRQASIAKMNADLAEERRLTAEANEQTAMHEKANVLRLSAFQTLDDLTQEANALWPAEPSMVERYRAWLARAENLVARIPEFRESLVEIEVRALPQTEAVIEERASLQTKDESVTREVTALESEGSKRREWRFAKEDDRWWHAQMEKLVAALERFADEETGLLHGSSSERGWGVSKRLSFAASIKERSVSGPEARERWSEAIEAIAVSEKYRGVKWSNGERLTPQLGLLPIGADPESGLWEFAHLQTGEPAQRGADRKLVLTQEMGLVFVLIPGGTFTMGSQNTDPSGRNYARQAGGDESPVHEVTLALYFLSKYEMTQGQWLRFTGENPSQYSRTSYRTSWNRAGNGWNALHPVEQVSWFDCVETLGRLGLVLPTEAQWENGARAGTATEYWSGNEVETLQEAGNVADAYARGHGGGGWTLIYGSWDDGQTVHAEVGSYRANAFGLHDVHGNVCEWCLDVYDGGFYGRSTGPDPVAPTEGAGERVHRGGSFGNAASRARSAYRDDSAAGIPLNNLGLRPVRTPTP